MSRAPKDPPVDFWQVVAQTVRVLRDPAEYVRREDERARKFANKVRRKTAELAEKLLKETEGENE